MMRPSTRDKNHKGGSCKEVSRSSGKTAYELAVEQGFVGSEIEWIHFQEGVNAQLSKTQADRAEAEADRAELEANTIGNHVENAITSSIAAAESETQAKLHEIAAEQHKNEIQGTLQEVTLKATDAENAATAAALSETNVSALATQVANDKQSVETSEQNVSALALQVSTDQATVDTDKQIVAADKVIVETLASQVNTDKDAVSGMLTNITSQADAVQANKDSVDLSESNVQTLAAQMTTDRQSVEDSEQNVTTLASQVSTDKTSVEQDLATVQQLKTDVETSENNVGLIKTDVEGIQTDVTAKAATVNTQHDTVLSAQQDVSTKHDTVIQKASEVDSNTSQVAADTLTVTNKRDEVESDRTAVETIKTEVESLKTDVDTAATTVADNLSTSNQHVIDTTQNKSDTEAALELAQKWASEERDVEVLNGFYSAMSYMLDAKDYRDEAVQAAQVVSGGLAFGGMWDASGGTFPSDPEDGSLLYKVEVGGVIDGKEVNLGDSLIYNNMTSTWLILRTSEIQVIWDEIQQKPATATRWPTFGEVTNKPSTYTPESHSHGYGDLPISSAQVNNWETAFGWGNHVQAGYAVSGTSGSQTRTNTQLDARYLQSVSWGQVDGKPTEFTPESHTHGYSDLPISSSEVNNWNTAHSWGNHADVGYLTEVSWAQVQNKPSTFTPSSHTHGYSDLPSDVAKTGDVTAAETAANNYTDTAIGNLNSGNWDTAFSWGNHSEAGYATTASLATVATSGDYEDLSNKPDSQAIHDRMDEIEIFALAGL